VIPPVAVIDWIAWPTPHPVETLAWITLVLTATLPVEVIGFGVRVIPVPAVRLVTPPPAPVLSSPQIQFPFTSDFKIWLAGHFWISEKS